jgi:hypothetical protein
VSLFGPSSDTVALFSSVQSVIGSGQVSEGNIGGSPCYELYGQYRNHPVHVHISTTGGIPLAVRFGMGLGQRPITLLLNHRRNTTIHGVPEVRTGDAQFDQLFLLNGFPDGVLRDALDGPVRAWLTEQFGAREPTLETQVGEISVAGVVAIRFKNLSRPMPPAEVVFWLDGLLPIATRLTNAFDRQCEAVLRTQGPQAAEQWVNGYVRAMQERAQRRSYLRYVIFGVLVGGPLVLALLGVVLAVALALAD